MSRKIVMSQARLAPGYMAANVCSTKPATAVAFLVSTGGNMPTLKVNGIGHAGRNEPDFWRLRICSWVQQAQSCPTSAKPMIVGITGGLGCGKSTVARALERRGFRRLD